MIMTIYLWHMTILVMVLGLSYLADGAGFTLDPGSASWWLSRPLWLLVLLLLLLPVAFLVSPLERQARDKGESVPTKTRLIAGAVTAGLGIALVALKGFDGDPLTGLYLVTLLLIFGGAAICGLRIKWRKKSAGASRQACEREA